MPRHKQKGGKIPFCGTNCKQLEDVSEPSLPATSNSIRKRTNVNLPFFTRHKVPIIENNSLHAFCVPKFFGNSIPPIPHEISENPPTKRIRFFVPSLNSSTIYFHKITNLEHNYIDIKNFLQYIDFLPFINIIIDKLKAFEERLRKNHLYQINKINYPIIHSLQIVFNKTYVKNLGDQYGVNDWHDDYDQKYTDVTRQFVIVLTPHLNTDFSIDPKYKKDINEDYIERYKTVIEKQMEDPFFKRFNRNINDKNKLIDIIKNNLNLYISNENIRRCPSTDIGSASYWKNEVIHRKPSIDEKDSTRIIIAVLFEFTTDKLPYDKLPYNYHIEREYYNSKNHLQQEVNVLSEIFNQDITEPQKIMGGKKNPIPCIDTEGPECDNYWGGKKKTRSRK